MAADSNTLYQEAKCYLCLGMSQSEALSLALKLRWLLSLNPLADTSVSALVSESSCLRCYANVSMFNLLSIALLRKIQVATIVDSFVDRAEITADSQIAALNVLVESALENGWWSKCDLIYPFVGGTALAHSQNLKSSNFTITWNGTVTHDANGITGDGLTGYGSTGYIPSSSGQILLTSAHASVYRRTTGLAGRFHFGIANEMRLGTTNATTLRGGINDSTTSNWTLLPSNFTGFIALTRTSTAAKTVFIGGIQKDVALAPTFISPFIVDVLGGAAGPDTVNLSGFTIGSGITFAQYQLMASDWQTFQTALGRQV